MTIIQYNGSQTEQQRHIQEQAERGLVLVEELHNIPEGTFYLGFMEPERITHTVEDHTDERIAELSSQSLILMDAVATLFETMGGA